jgi:magnesium-transporting ATPase (P-type)
MLASYFVHAFSLQDIFTYDLKKKNQGFLFVSLTPLALYFLITFLNLADFVKIIGIGGVVSGGFMIILILLMNMKAKKSGDRKPEFSVPMNWFIFAVLSLIFLAGIFLEIFNSIPY